MHHHNRTEDPEATTPETTTVNYTTTEYIPPENWVEMFIWDQNGTTIDKYVDIPHRKANYIQIKIQAQGKFRTSQLGFKGHFLFTALNIFPILAPKQMSTMKKSRNFLLWLS